MEHFKDIKGYKGLYQIGDMGTIKSLGGKIRIMKQTIGASGRYFVILRKNGKQKTKYVHILVLETFRGKPEGMVACHNNMNVRDNRLSNLRWDMPDNETIDRIKRGTHTCGEKAPKSKLTIQKVKQIKRMLHEGVKQIDIAKEFGVNQSSISDIRTGKSWKHLSFF